MFVPEDCSSKIGNKAEDHLHTNPSLKYGSKPFSGTVKHTCIPQIKWKCPSMFILNSDWKVVAGEFSKETETQNYREKRVLEAGSTRPSAIAPSPSISPGLEECDYDDLVTPVIPVIPVEEEEEVIVNEKPVVGVSTALEADIVAAAASAAFTAIMKSNEKGSLVDTDLLVKILSDPKMIEILSKKYSGFSETTKTTPIYELQDMNKKLLQAVISIPMDPTTKTAIPSPETVPLTSTAQNPLYFGPGRARDDQVYKRPVDKLELPGTVPLTSTAHILGSNDTASASDFFFTQPDLLQNLTDVGPSLRTTTSRASMSNQDPPTELSRRPGYLLEDYGPNMMSSTEKHNQSMPLETQRSRSFSQHSSSSVKAPVEKDVNYYKTLIKLHGSKEEHTEIHRPRASAPTAIFGQGDARAKMKKVCRFFNSSQGCRRGLRCPFQHDSSIKVEAESVRDAHTSKRIKFCRKLP
ncbi:zinc finger CCCH domain-containing protein 6 isoform X2 [Spinacia oleracea]|nr:zinc finger CCCH domain-containing protein 6-like isoform X2 [Spinacia oleracea]